MTNFIENSLEAPKQVLGQSRERSWEHSEVQPLKIRTKSSKVPAEAASKGETIESVTIFNSNLLAAIARSLGLTVEERTMLVTEVKLCVLPLIIVNTMRREWMDIIVVNATKLSKCSTHQSKDKLQVNDHAFNNLLSTLSRVRWLCLSATRASKACVKSRAANSRSTERSDTRTEQTFRKYDSVDRSMVYRILVVDRVP